MFHSYKLWSADINGTVSDQTHAGQQDRTISVYKHTIAVNLLFRMKLHANYY